MLRVITGFFCLLCLTAEAQVLRDINYNYVYDPQEVFNFKWKVVRVEEAYKVFYEILPNDPVQDSTTITVQLELRESLGDRRGQQISTTTKQAGSIVGSEYFQPEQDQSIIVAKITLSDPEASRTFTYYKQLPTNKSAYISSDSRAIVNSFTPKNQRVTFDGFEAGKSIHVTYYSIPFPAGAPAFSTTQAKVAKKINPDSTFIVNGTSPVTLYGKGLYLAQQDTSSVEGISFRVEEDYPKLGKLESLVGPLIYICTKQETEKLKQAGSDKKKFDQTILTITGNAERARKFMRNYFKRVEQANIYFSSYKEGWRTDRGMIYIIFGLPDEVYFFGEREVWEYKNETIKIRFQFIKSPTVFDPDNYVLIRDKKFTKPWYVMVDLWRQARF